MDANIEQGMSILDQYVDHAPSRFIALDIFKNEWSSYVPGYGGGQAQLFDDHRIKWFEENIGGFDGKRILELGPLEGGHTYMMSKAGGNILSLEANTRAFLKCLLVQRALGFRADFQLGDFRPYLLETERRFEFLLASGVLYHMTNPVEMLLSAMRVADSIGIWTHYFLEDINLKREDLIEKFSPEQTIFEHHGKSYIAHEQRYNESLKWAGFCGGSARNSFWMARDSLLGIFDDNGFDVTIAEDAPDHQNGPCILFCAQRRKS